MLRPSVWVSNQLQKGLFFGGFGGPKFQTLKEDSGMDSDIFYMGMD